jgi:organic radical activating enzyme
MHKSEIETEARTRLPMASGTPNLAPLPVLEDPLTSLKEAQPESVTILPSYRCNAACAECCFESHPGIKHRMDRDALLALIDRIHDELPHVKYVVMSGGEVTLLREDLLAAISRLTELGLASRIVSNGHWGRTDKSAEWWISRLKAAGLSELNLSTGDEHQVFVPFESVARAAYLAVKGGLLTLVVVEGKDKSRFRIEDLRAHPLITEILNSDELRRRFILITNIWMPFHADTDITNEGKTKYEPCDNVFTNFVANPHGNLMSCCGLTMEYIPELKVGHVDSHRLQETYADQYRDLLKLWIWLDGTQFIFDLAVQRGGLDVRLISPHMCSTCVQIYKDPHLRDVVRELVEENAEQIVFRAAIKARLTGRVSDMGAQPSFSGGIER